VVFVITTHPTVARSLEEAIDVGLAVGPPSDVVREASGDDVAVVGIAHEVEQQRDEGALGLARIEVSAGVRDRPRYRLLAEGGGYDEETVARAYATARATVSSS